MSEQETLRQTALHGFNESHGARFVGFTGWALPVQFPGGILAEHKACRGGAALFDVSHMQQVRLDHTDGADKAAAALETLVPGGITTLAPGAARYTQFTDENGGVLDDLIVSHAGDHLYLVCNAARAAHDLAHLSQLASLGVSIQPLDDALMALQGPKAADLLGALVPEAPALRFMQSTTSLWQGAALRISRLGYTGEDGFEIAVPQGTAADLAMALMASGDVTLAGLGARDSLRLEAGLCLYGQDLTTDTTPVEAGLGWSIPRRRREAGGFPGAALIAAQLRDGPPRCLVSILPEGRAPARAGTAIEIDGAPVGTVTSGGFGPSIGGPVALGYVASAHAVEGTEVSLIVRGTARPARIVATPVIPHRYVRA